MIIILAQLPMFVVVGVRSAPEQYQLWRQGRQIPGPHVRPGHPLGDTVTRCDGYHIRSNHQVDPSDQLGKAVDCAWLGGDPFGLQHPWAAYRVAGRAQGLIWGGDWPSRDRPHVELAHPLQ